MGVRPDLGRRSLLLLLVLFVAASVAVVWLGGSARAGSPARHLAAIAGSLLLLIPFAFSTVKRTGLSENPPAWFVAHALSSTVGGVLVLWHSAGGDVISPPGLVLAAVVFLIAQGLIARALLAHSLSYRFGARPQGFGAPNAAKRAAIAQVLAAKRALLEAIDPSANEALFSLLPRHWWRHPWLSIRFQRLCAAESRLLGARGDASWLLAHWRRAHIVVAVLFFVGLLAHVIVVTFFAGYVAGTSDIYWWHLRV